MKYVNSSHQNATHVRMFGPDGNFEHQEIIGKTNDSIRIQTPRGSVWLSYLNCEQLFGVCCWYRKVKEQEPPVVKLFTKGNLDTSTLESHGSLVVLFSAKGSGLDATPELLTMNGKVYRATLEVSP